jgi:DNA-binding MarR family transcriptional regulator
MSSHHPDRAALLAAVLREVRRMTAQSVLISQAVSERFGLSSSDLECLDLALLSGGATAGEFAKVTGLTTGAITGVIDRLERAGYVRRERDPADRRKVIVRARPAMTRRIAPLYDSLQREMTAIWSTQRRAARADRRLLTRSCDLAVQEIASCRTNDRWRGSGRRRGGGLAPWPRPDAGDRACRPTRSSRSSRSPSWPPTRRGRATFWSWPPVRASAYGVGSTASPVSWPAWRC